MRRPWLGDEILVFAEFVERGSVAEWIKERRLTGLAQILDVAIQFAWGLHAAHEAGLVHQDVKPGNALVTAEGVVKVSDFGLARARATAEGHVTGAAEQSVLVSGRGLTPAYCSPEQMLGRPLSRKTDVWSWGVSILEMFTGKVTWACGTNAPEALNEFLKRTAETDQVAMPGDVAAVLQKCFRHDPAERWASLTEAAEALQRAYRDAVGQEYPRTPPAAVAARRHVVVNHHGSSPKRVGEIRPELTMARPFFRGFSHFPGRGNLS